MTKEYQYTKLDDNLYETWNPVIRAIFDDKIKKVREFVRGEVVLDAGSGEGYVLSRVDCRIKVGCDVDLKKLKIGKNRFGILFSMCETEGLSFKDGAFDSLICSEVLEHVLDLKKTFSEFNRVLKEDGTLVVTLPREHILTLGKIISLRWNKHPDINTLMQVEDEMSKMFRIERTANTLFFLHKVYLCKKKP
ncbi:MAG: class I SAM-dependent methyltransferase [Candidatus Altiarchaeota archaeon]